METIREKFDLYSNDAEVSEDRELLAELTGEMSGSVREILSMFISAYDTRVRSLNATTNPEHPTPPLLIRLRSSLKVLNRGMDKVTARIRQRETAEKLRNTLPASHGTVQASKEMGVEVFGDYWG